MNAVRRIPHAVRAFKWQTGRFFIHDQHQTAGLPLSSTAADFSNEVRRRRRLHWHPHLLI